MQFYNIYCVFIVIVIESVLIDDNYSDGNLTTTAVGNVLPEVPHIRRNSIVTSTLMSSSTSHKRIKRKLSETNETIKSECRKKMKTSTKMYYQSVEMDRELINVSTSCGIPIETLRKKVDNILKIFRKFYSESVEPGMIAITPTVEYTEAMSVIDGDRLTENVHADKSATKGEHDILDNLKLAVLSTLPSWTFHIEANRYISTDIRPFAIRLAF